MGGVRSTWCLAGTRGGPDVHSPLPVAGRILFHSGSHVPADDYAPTSLGTGHAHGLCSGSGRRVPRNEWLEPLKRMGASSSLPSYGQKIPFYFDWVVGEFTLL